MALHESPAQKQLLPPNAQFVLHILPTKVLPNTQATQLFGELHASHPATVHCTTQAPDTTSYPVSHLVQAVLEQVLQLLEHGEHFAAFT